MEKYYIKIRSFMLFCLSFFAIFTPATCSASSNGTDVRALLSFKAAIAQDPFGVMASWNETTHFCTWNGIRCSNMHLDRVVKINLTSQSLMGSLSPHLGNLSFLRSLILRNNSFVGQIPQEISLLRRLEYADFSSNSFIGPIPRNLSQCINLVHLSFGVNSLSGTIPPEIGSLNKLEFLSLSKNNLSGPTPPSFGNLTSLTTLSLSTCGLEGKIPESLVHLKALSSLILGVNSFTGRIPSGLFNISAITLFAVHSNLLEGVIPSDIGITLPNLIGLYLGDNLFSGIVPITLSNASFLEEIVLLYNDFTGPMPKVGTLSHLTTFTIAVNHIQDDISFISSWTNCTNLTLLEIGDNPLTGSLPSSIANFSSQLTSLAIPNTQIYGKIPLHIGNLVGLNRFALYGNNLDGPIPPSIGKLSNLHDLYLSENKFTYEIPSSIGNLTMLLHLSLEDNSFYGSILQTLMNCTNLLVLNVSHNNLSGPIPREIINLPSSISFDLSHNAFTGAIPSEIGSLSNLVNLDLSYNRFSGPIPDALRNCFGLQWLHVEGNLLQGEIPLELSALKSLQNLDISANNLSGSIPSFFGQLKDLQIFNLSFNRLQGEVPRVGVFTNTSAISLEGNKELCGGILELNLPPCPPSPSHDPSKKNMSSILIKVLIPTVGLLICCALALVIFLLRQRILHKKNQSSHLFSSNAVQFLRLSYAHLQKATDDFSNSNLIGVGRFGSVYQGILDDWKTLIAVKVLNLAVRGASKSFIAECNALRRVRHRNLLKLLSVCESIDFQGNAFKALVYDFKANGSLDQWLHRENEQDGKENLSFSQRLSIAVDIAQALEYLHFGTDSTIVHGDLKPSNILLDHDMTAFVGDFGLAKIISSTRSIQESSSSIWMKGTIGYVAPEYATNYYMVTTQGDVYSFGILLLEMFTSKRPTDEAFFDHHNLHNFVSHALQNDVVMGIVDSRIHIQDDVMSNKMRDTMISILSIAVACSKAVPRDRPSMTDVVNDLRKLRAFYLPQN